MARKIVNRSKPSKRGRVTVKTKKAAPRRTVRRKTVRAKDAAKARVKRSAAKATSKGIVWWKGLTAAQKKAYLARHPNSKYGKKGGGTTVSRRKAKEVRSSYRQAKVTKSVYGGRKPRTKTLKPLRKAVTKTKAIRKPRSKRVATPKRTKAAAGIVNIGDIARNFRASLRSAS